MSSWWMILFREGWTMNSDTLFIHCTQETTPTWRAAGGTIICSTEMFVPFVALTEQSATHAVKKFQTATRMVKTLLGQPEETPCPRQVEDTM